MADSGRKWGTIMLMGEYHHNIDTKNRLIIPSKFREEIGDRLIVTRGLDGCLFVYSLDKWSDMARKLDTLSFTKKDARNFTRFFLSGATMCEVDGQGRIVIPPSLISYANISKECTIIGVNDRLEIWATSKFEFIMSDNLEEIEKSCENLFKGADYDA